MNNYNDQKKSNKKFQSDEKEIIINDHNLNLHIDPDNYSYKEESFEEVHHGDHKDFTSSDLKEDEIMPIDPKLVITNNVSDRRTNRNINHADSDNKMVGRMKLPQEEVDLDISDNINDDKINLKKKTNKLVKNKAIDNKQSMERISEVEEDKYNTIIDKYNDGMNKDEFNIDDKNFDEFMNKNINSSNLKEYFDPNFNNTDSSERFRQEMSHNTKRNIIDIRSPKTHLQNKRVEEDLYKDAIIRKKKREMIEENNVMNILLNSNKTKISNNSHKIAINKIEKYIEYVIYTYDREKIKKISFIDLGYILTELKVFREILKEENKKQNEYSSYREIKSELKNVRDNERRRKTEIDFYEQIWIVLNPDNNECIKVTVLAEFLKILFSPVSSSIKEISSVLKQFLQTAFFLNSNADRKKRFISPITEKSISEEDIWSLEKLVKEFLNLKQNMLAYQSINNVSKKLTTELENKNFSFTPQIINNKDDRSRIKFFEGRLDALLDREKIKRQVYQETKKDMDEEKMKDCTFKPKINKKNMENSYKNLKKYMKLYKLQGEKIEKIHKMKEQQERIKDLEEVSKYTFQPVLQSNIKYYQKSKNKEKPYKYDEAVDRLRSANQKKFQQKKLLEYNFDNKKYERVMKTKDHIQPFNITDLNKKPEDEEQKKNKKKTNEDEYFSIQISIAKGKDRLLRIHKNDNPIIVAENFCRVYGLKNDEIVERLASTIQNFMSIHLANNENLDLHNNMENDIFENIETGVLNHLQTNNNNTNINLSKELAASKASIVSSNN